MKFECIDLNWDTKYFDVKTGRVNLFDELNEDDQTEIMNFCIKFEFITITNFNNKHQNNYWLGVKTNAFLTDINIQYKKVVLNRNYVDPKFYSIQSNLNANEDILKIARNSFEFSRFFNDPNLNKSKAKDIYFEWINNSFNKTNKYFVINKNSTNVVGFLLFSLKQDTCTIELIAVDKNIQRKRIGYALFEALEVFLYKNGVKRIEVGTQIDNLKARKFYEKLGFEESSINSIYHIWNKL